MAWKIGNATDWYILPIFPLVSCLPRNYASLWGWTHSGWGGLTAHSSSSLVLPEATLLWPQHV